MKTWSDLSDYLLEKMDKADDEKSKANPTFSREQMWNHYMEMCVGKSDREPLPIKTTHILLANVKRDF
jgi:hypothetical protein